MNIDFKKQQGKKVDKKAKDMTLEELREKIAVFRKDGIDIAPLATEIHKRNAISLSCLIFVIIGAPLAMITRRREKSINFGFAFLIVAFYYLMFMGFETLATEGEMVPALAMAIPNVFFACIGIVLLYKTCLS